MSGSTCGGASSWTSCPSASNSGSSLDLTATQTTPGRDGSDGNRSNGGNGNAHNRGGNGGTGPAIDPNIITCDQVAIDCDADTGLLPTPEINRPAQPEEDPPTPGIPAVTITDLASFAPASVPLGDEPDGVGIVGMPVNFVVDADATTAHGSLFDLPVTVRFVPTSFTFDPGDGEVYTTSTGGRSWTALGVPQFTATDTSHAYAERGTYTARATVHYAASVDFGTGLQTVPGTVDITTPATSIRIVDVHTALVDKTCDEDPSGPGC